MDMTEADKEERLERQKKELEFRAKKRNSRLFLFFGSIFEIAETLVVILLLWIFFALLVFRVFNLSEAASANIFSVCTFISFIGGIFLGFLIYKAMANFVIEKFNLSDKLTNELLSHYSKRFREAEKEAKKK